MAVETFEALGTGCNILGAACGLISAIYFYKGSKAKPWALQTWDGDTQAEQAHEVARVRESKIGFGWLAAGFAFQLAGSLLPLIPKILAAL